ncbi:MAG TPA: hypothetical protein VHJ38_08905 [Nitrososphaeraceae archaeon]|nr:hypothetical protein [Nitrososphaeraceae archaeon]
MASYNNTTNNKFTSLTIDRISSHDKTKKENNDAISIFDEEKGLNSGAEI